MNFETTYSLELLKILVPSFSTLPLVGIVWYMMNKIDYNSAKADVKFEKQQAEYNEKFNKQQTEYNEKFNKQQAESNAKFDKHLTEIQKITNEFSTVKAQHELLKNHFKPNS